MSVNSHNGWDRLKEIIVGTAERSAAVLSWEQQEPPKSDVINKAREVSSDLNVGS